MTQFSFDCGVLHHDKFGNSIPCPGHSNIPDEPTPPRWWYRPSTMRALSVLSCMLATASLTSAETISSKLAALLAATFAAIMAVHWWSR